MRIKKEILMHPAYQKFSEANSDVIDKIYMELMHISSSILEETALTDHRLEELFNITEAISAVFANFNRPDLIELSNRLTSIVIAAQKNSQENTKLITTAKKLMEKLNTSKIKIFENLEPEAIIQNIDALKEKEYESAPETHKPRDLKFKWVIFKRNGSSFITRFNSIDTLRIDENFNINFKEKTIEVTIDDTNLSATDLMRNTLREPVAPSNIIILDGGKYCYCADKITKEICSSKDIILPITEAMGKYENFAGRVRLFGENHFVLKYHP